MNIYKVTIHLIGKRRIEFKTSSSKSREDSLSSMVSKDFYICNFDKKSLLVSRDKIIDIEIDEYI